MLPTVSLSAALLLMLAPVQVPAPKTCVVTSANSILASKPMLQLAQEPPAEPQEPDENAQPNDQNNPEDQDENAAEDQQDQQQENDQQNADNQGPVMPPQAPPEPPETEQPMPVYPPFNPDR